MNKKNLKLGIILIILIIVAYVYQGPYKEWGKEKGLADNFLSSVDAEKINKIAVLKGGKETIIEKQSDGRWKINHTFDFYLSDQLANSLKEQIREMSEAELDLISKDSEKKKNFYTDEASGVTIRLLEGENEVAKFIAGLSGDDYQSSHISKKDISETYLLKANINFLTSPDSWYDKFIFRSIRDNITKIRFQYSNNKDKEFIIERSGNTGEDNIGWSGVSPYKFKVNEEKIKGVLDIMSSLYAAEIPEQKFEGTGLEKHNIIVQATGGGIDNTIMVGDMVGEGENAQYYVKRADSDNIYLISKQQVDELNKTINDLR